MPNRIARLLNHPVLPLVFLLLANVAFYVSIASTLSQLQ
jgi:hypothetical protein